MDVQPVRPVPRPLRAARCRHDRLGDPRALQRARTAGDHLACRREHRHEHRRAPASSTASKRCFHERSREWIRSAYGPAGGSLPLRERLVELMATQDIEAEPHQLSSRTERSKPSSSWRRSSAIPATSSSPKPRRTSVRSTRSGRSRREMQSVATDDNGIIPEALDDKLVCAHERRASREVPLSRPDVPEPERRSRSQPSVAPQIIDICATPRPA